MAQTVTLTHRLEDGNRVEVTTWKVEPSLSVDGVRAALDELAEELVSQGRLEFEPLDAGDADPAFVGSATP